MFKSNKYLSYSHLNVNYCYLLHYIVTLTFKIFVFFWYSPTGNMYIMVLYCRFVLIHDLDELVVPAPPHRTYTSFLEDYDRKHHNLSSTHCVSVRSAFFYRGFGAGNPEFGEHLPLHRYTQRWNAEPLGDPSQVSYFAFDLDTHLYKGQNIVKGGLT